MLYRVFLIFNLLIVSKSVISLEPQSYQFKDCHVSVRDDVLLFENSKIARHYYWNKGNLIGKSIEDKLTKQVWQLKGELPDFSVPGLYGKARSGKLDVREIPGNNVVPGHLQISINFSIDSLEIKRVCQLFPDTPAIGCHYKLRGHPHKNWSATPASSQSKEMIENSDLKSTSSEHTLERLQLPGKHWAVTATRFKGVTDYNNTLVQSNKTELYRNDEFLKGNLLFLKNKLNSQQIFMLRESPATEDQLHYPGYDFSIANENVRSVGLGIGASDIRKKEWIPSYGFVTGVAGMGDMALLGALHRYQNNLRVLESKRDYMILMNTWGDRGKDGRINEEFSLREIQAGAKLGVTHLQLDDGWQAGLSKNSANKTGHLWEDWTKDSWKPHPQRFPNGLAKTVAFAKENNMEIGIWFNPSSANSYKHWKRDADILIQLYKDHGIRTFKIDGIELPDKQAEMNLFAMFERVVEGTDGNVVFNPDVTAGRRQGYFFMRKYGNTFLENRYTDWGNYYPYRTLRNLWMLSKYVPAPLFQIEFLNKWRNTEKYAADDPFSPEKVPFDYIFATTMMAQPLAWFEGTGLPGEAFSIAPMVATYKSLQIDMHKGLILPIGDEPNGASWTGFQSILEDRGYVLVFREYHQESSFTLQTWLPESRKVRFKSILGAGKDFHTKIKEGGAVKFNLPSPHSFALYQYTID